MGLGGGLRNTCNGPIEVSFSVERETSRILITPDLYHTHHRDDRAVNDKVFRVSCGLPTRAESDRFHLRREE